RDSSRNLQHTLSAIASSTNAYHKIASRCLIFPCNSNPSSILRCSLYLGVLPIHIILGIVFIGILMGAPPTIAEIQLMNVLIVIFPIVPPNRMLIPLRPGVFVARFAGHMHRLRCPDSVRQRKMCDSATDVGLMQKS